MRRCAKPGDDRGDDGKPGAGRAGAGADARRADVRKLVRAERASFCPAAPADVAKFVADCASLGIERLWPAVQDISKMHVALGLADPTLGGVAAAAVSDVAAHPAAAFLAERPQAALQVAAV